MESFTVQDGDRAIVFDGVCLSRASSEGRGKDRWIELALYRTAGGTYVTHGIGRSVVDGERDRSWVQRNEDAAGVVDALYMVGDEGQQYLTHVAKRLLGSASEVDVAIDRAYRYERIA